MACDEGTMRWTRRLIPYIRPWVDRKWGEVNFYLTQILEGHDSFQSYLHRFKLSNTDEYCGMCDTVKQASGGTSQAEIKLGRMTLERSRRTRKR
ncbi:hypothetical protein JTB14_002848 [Gonioctena quinquepunctata]|nr:hypothetical protein JTB14_002848 [Gonioctena quinquepunctata]